VGETYGTKIAEALAPVSFIASLTLAKTGLPRWVSPAFLGLVPPTTWVPVSNQYHDCLELLQSLVYHNQWLVGHENWGERLAMPRLETDGYLMLLTSLASP